MPYSQPLRNAAYSPISYTPHTISTLNDEGADATYYYDLLHDAIRWRNAGYAPKERYHTKLSGGVFTVSLGVYPVAVVRGVTTGVHLSNIYHLFKAYQYDLDYWTGYLQKYGVPTLVEAVRTGGTPPHNDEGFNWDGFEELDV